MKHLLLILTSFLILSSCTSNKVPSNAESVNEDIYIYPDIKDVTVPQCIAPLNFFIENSCEDAVVELRTEKGDVIIESAQNNKITFSPKEWKKFISNLNNESITYTPYLKKNGKWFKYNSFSTNVLNEPIDSFVTYRLIEPSYMSTGQVGLFQFDLTTGTERTIIRRCKNITSESLIGQSCVNCHSAQKGNPQNKLFYYRGKEGGLILTYNGEIKKINTKVDGMYCSTTYPAWHPALPFIVFSENDVYQDFPTLSSAKTEFFDRRTDLILYDIQSNEIFVVGATKQKETNPTWEPNGEYLYYAVSDSSMNPMVFPQDEYPKLKYDIARVKFDPTSKSFSSPEIILNVTKDSKSATFPRISPDNKFLLVNISEYGASPHTHVDADLYAMNLETKEFFECTNANSPESESYHDFSSRSNWFVFYSRREDGNYGRAYISYLDSTGKCTKPFQLPHQNPLMDRERLKLYNMIEFSNSSVKFNESDFYDVIWNESAIQAQSDPRNQATNGQTGASVISNGNVDAHSGASILQNHSTNVHGE